MTSDMLTDDDTAIREVVARLSRPGPSGGSVIERAAILAEGSNSEAIISWIIAHAGEPEASAPPAPTRGLHGTRLGGGGAQRHPSRYVVPIGVLT
jgi:hypothetical protein